jgi:hypothetical protein
MLLLILSTVAWGQERELPIDRRANPFSGIRIRSAWLGGGWYDVKAPSPTGVVKSNLWLGSTGAAINWTKNSERSQGWANYAGEYNRADTKSTLNAVNQGFDFGINRRLVQRWTMRLSGEGEFLNFGSRLFRFPGPTRLQTGEDATSAINPVQNAVQSGAAFPDLSRGAFDPTALLIGGDYYRLGTSAGLGFAQSTRSSWSFAGNASQTVYKGTGQNNDQASAFIPFRRVYDASGSLNWRYNLTPRTVLNWENSTGYTWAGFSSTGREQYKRAQSTVQLARTFTTHWYAAGGGGISASEGFTTTQSSPWFVTYLATGSLGYVRRDQAFMFNASHSAGDGYGFGAQDNTQAVFTYTYRPAASAWGLNVAAVYQRLKVGDVSPFDGWVGMAGFSRRITRHTFLLFEAAQTSTIAFTAGRLIPVGASRSALDSLAQRAIRVSFVYQPMAQMTK